MLLVYFILISLPFSAGQQNFVVPWNSTKFGPDGPWQAVDIVVGGNDSSRYVNVQNSTTVTVYPGGEWQSLTFGAAACESFPDSLCGSGGFWEPDEDQAMQQLISYSPSGSDNASGIQWGPARIVALGLTIGQKTVFNASIANAVDGNVTYPNGVVGGVPLGSLSLGADDESQFFSLSDDVGDGIDAWIFPGRLFHDKEIPSYSYGLHIGSAAFDYPGSLIFGGYDKGRVIAPVTSFPNQNAVDLIDVGIGVEFGDSPFDFGNKTNLLAGGQTKITPNPLSPYLSLPGKTCENLASLLPVTFDQALKYYVWKTEDERYSKVVSSPAFISFTFPPAPGDSNNVTIKVPFALLNLTLDHPIVDSPTQYFPCQPYDDGTPVLGRAFLQAAFLGRNWGTNTTWLAQAPGPGIARQGLGELRTDIAEDATTIEGFAGSNMFNQSWQGHWSVIASKAGEPTSPSPFTSPTGSSGGLSSGGKAGVGVGVSVAAIAVIGAFIFIWRKRSLKKKALELYAPTNGNLPPYAEHDKNVGQAHYGQEAPVYNRPVSEMPGENAEREPVEIPDTSNPQMR